MTTKENKYSHEATQALTALKRARLRAEEIARATRTMLVEARNGRPILIPPPPRKNEEEDQG